LLSLALYSSQLPRKFFLPNTNSFNTEHQILDQCKTKRTENIFKCGEGSTLNNSRSQTGEELQSFDVFGKHLTTSNLFQNYEYFD
jgi:hypothetical protein